MQFYLSHLNLILDNQFYSLIIDDIVEVDVERGCLTKPLQGTDVSKKYKYDNSENSYNQLEKLEAARSAFLLLPLVTFPGLTRPGDWEIFADLRLQL